MLSPLSDRPFLSKQQAQQFFLCHLVLEHFHKFFLADIIVAQRLELWQIKKIKNDIFPSNEETCLFDEVP